MSGIYESWMQKLVAAVMQRESEANVVVVNWVSMAQQLYPDAVNHTVTVGRGIADLLDWLQVSCGATLSTTSVGGPHVEPRFYLLYRDVLLRSDTVFFFFGRFRLNFQIRLPAEVKLNSLSIRLTQNESFSASLELLRYVHGKTISKFTCDSF